MPQDILPSQVVVFTRDEIRDQYVRDYSIRNPSGSTQPGQQPAIDAEVMADTIVPVYANAVTIGNGIAVQTMTRAQLTNEVQRLGSDVLPAQGASGGVTAAGSQGGGTIFAGDEIKSSAGLRYRCTATGVYPPGAYVPILAVDDTGPSTNQPAGTILTWTSPRPGIAATAPVATQSDGSGLTGGRNVESSDELRARIISLRANPPASGNDADVQKALTEVPGLSVQQGFTFPSVVTPGSTAFTFTLRPAAPGSNRIPTAAQLEQARAYLVGRFPKDSSGIFATMIVASPVTIMLRASWAAKAKGWADATPWPLYVAADPILVLGAVAPTASSTRLGTLGTTTSAPQVGQTVAFYDAPNATFRKKRIATVTQVSAGVSWDVAFDMTNAASDATYVPVVGQPACPWSDSLPSVVPAIVPYFDTLGPGEQVGSFFDEGYRRRRSPRSPDAWPSQITNRLLGPLYTLPTIGDVSLLSPTTPATPATGSAGVSSNMFTLGSMAVFA